MIRKRYWNSLEKPRIILESRVSEERRSSTLATSNRRGSRSIRIPISRRSSWIFRTASSSMSFNGIGTSDLSQCSRRRKPNSCPSVVAEKVDKVPLFWGCWSRHRAKRHRSRWRRRRVGLQLKSSHLGNMMSRNAIFRIWTVGQLTSGWGKLLQTKQKGECNFT